MSSYFNCIMQPLDHSVLSPVHQDTDSEHTSCCK